MELQDHTKPIVEHKEFHGEVRNEDLTGTRFSYVFAVSVAFYNVNFTQTDFTNCYFRNCRFIQCNFTGVTIKDSNFKGAQFTGCNFRYTSWENTILDERFLDYCLPSEVNLARDLTRSLRVNFSQIGNYHAVNKAASMEVKLTGQHLYNAAYSREAYYRDKYNGWDRILHGFGHARWKALDLLWGNGESIPRVIVSGLVVIIVAALFLMRGPSQLAFSDAIWLAFAGFWGALRVASIPDYYVVTLTIIRFILFGLFMAILVKRLSRR